MKKQTIAIIATAGFLLAVGVAIFLHFRKKRAADTSAIYAFLNEFNDKLHKKDVDSVMHYFDAGLNKNFGYRDLVIKLMGLDNSPENGEANTSPTIALTLGSAEIKTLNPVTSEVTVPAVLSFEKLETRNTLLILKLEKQGDTYKIKQIVADRFMLDYVTYTSYIQDKTMRDEDRFSPETLAAFKAANELKGKYDSVIWFAHVNNQTYYYVLKGEWEGIISDSTKAKYKMGLVGPDMKEVIPVDFTLIHNINGTFDNLIEVERYNKRGFYDLTGKNVVPIEYDNIYPVNNPQYLAVLKKGDDFFWLRNDYSVSEKTDLKMAEILPMIKKMGPYNLTDSGLGEKNITEYNSRSEPGSIYIPPSYLVDLNLMSTMITFKNPLRKRVQYDDVNKQYLVQAGIPAQDAGNNWFQAVFYKIRSYFLGGRSEFYETKNLIVLDNRHNKVYTSNISLSNTNEEDEDGLGRGEPCDVNMIRALNDSLFEVKSGSSLYAQLYDDTKAIQGGVYYHYLAIRNGKLVTLPNKRQFSFTKYVKMNDSYLTGCYNISEGKDYKDWKYHTVNTLTPDMLNYMKNEIYADYAYQFKDKRWMQIFADWYEMKDNDSYKTNASVDDSLTVIDKYNINFITQKLNTLKSDKAKTALK